MSTDATNVSGVPLYDVRDPFRTSTRFLRASTFTVLQLCERSAMTPSMQRLLADPDGHMQPGEMMKDGDTSTVVKVRVDDRILVVKRFNLVSVWHWLRRAPRRTRAWNCWAHALYLESIGIAAVKPVAILERRFGLLRGTSYFISEYIEGPHALDALAQGDDIVQAATQLSEVIHALYEARISHGDMKATNFIMTDRGVVLIDLDGTRAHQTRAGFRRAFRRDLKRFMKNWQDRPALMDRFENLLGDLNP